MLSWQRKSAKRWLQASFLKEWIKLSLISRRKRRLSNGRKRSLASS
jgi:hypothetical protein